MNNFSWLMPPTPQGGNQWYNANQNQRTSSGVGYLGPPIHQPPVGGGYLGPPIHQPPSATPQFSGFGTGTTTKPDQLPFQTGQSDPFQNAGGGPSLLGPPLHQPGSWGTMPPVLMDHSGNPNTPRPQWGTGGMLPWSYEALMRSAGMPINPNGPFTPSPMGSDQSAPGIFPMGIPMGSDQSGQDAVSLPVGGGQADPNTNPPPIGADGFNESGVNNGDDGRVDPNTPGGAGYQGWEEPGTLPGGGSLPPPATTNPPPSNFDPNWPGNGSFDPYGTGDPSGIGPQPWNSELGYIPAPGESFIPPFGNTNPINWRDNAGSNPGGGNGSGRGGMSGGGGGESWQGRLFRLMAPYQIGQLGHLGMQAYRAWQLAHPQAGPGGRGGGGTGGGGGGPETAQQRAWGDRNFTMAGGNSYFDAPVAGSHFDYSTGRYVMDHAAHGFNRNFAGEQQIEDPFKFGRNDTSEAGHTINTNVTRAPGNAAQQAALRAWSAAHTTVRSLYGG